MQAPCWIFVDKLAFRPTGRRFGSSIFSPAPRGTLAAFSPSHFTRLSSLVMGFSFLFLLAGWRFWRPSVRGFTHNALFQLEGLQLAGHSGSVPCKGTI